jgi:Ca2+/Na+ antiporter
MFKNFLFLLSLLAIGLVIQFTFIGDFIGHWSAFLIALVFVLCVFVYAFKKVGLPKSENENKNIRIAGDEDD